MDAMMVWVGWIFGGVDRVEDLALVDGASALIAFFLPTWLILVGYSLLKVRCSGLLNPDNLNLILNNQRLCSALDWIELLSRNCESALSREGLLYYGVVWLSGGLVGWLVGEMGTLESSINKLMRLIERVRMVGLL